MAKRKQEEGNSGSPAWMSTFSDLMNLLLCFFVLLFAMSDVNAQKFQEVAASLSASFSVLPQGGSALSDDGILVGSGASQLNALSDYYNNMGLNTDGDMDQETEEAYKEVEKEGMSESEKMAEQIENNLESEKISSQVEVTATSKYVVLNLSGGLLFDSGKAELKADAIDLIDQVADSIKAYDDNTISIEGHTDNVPISNSKYPNNMRLSLDRSYSVFDYFVNTKGFDETSLSASGRGDALPIASNATPEGRAQNRRVEIKIYNSLYS